MRYYPVLKADAGSVPCSTTNTPNPNPHRLGFFLPVTPVLARFPGLASRAAPLRSRRFRPRRRLSVLRFLWWSRERSRGHFLCWHGFIGGRLWSATPVAVATEGDDMHRYAVGYSRPGKEGHQRLVDPACRRATASLSRPTLINENDGACPRSSFGRA